jgi:hypothetical protein
MENFENNADDQWILDNQFSFCFNVLVPQNEYNLSDLL